MKKDTPSKQVHTAVSHSALSGSFVSSILAGTLLGYLGDRVFGTDPWLVVIGIIVGSYAGFMKMWQIAKFMEDDPRA